MHFLRIRKLFFTDNALLVLAVIFFILAGSLNDRLKKPHLTLDKQATAININKDLLIFLSAGNKRLITDLLWVQTLLESDIAHYKKNDLNSWMYLRFMTIAELDPQFYENYLYGGQYLSIVKDDLNGAIKLLERGVKYFPQDFKLRYNLGFIHYFERSDYTSGHFWLKNIADHPHAPSFLKVIVNKMKFQVDQNYEISLLFIRDLIKNSKDKYLTTKLKKDLYALKAERDLNCLNSRRAGCDPSDAAGQPYILKNGRYYSFDKFVPYRLKKKGDRKKTEPVNTL